MLNIRDKEKRISLGEFFFIHYFEEGMHLVGQQRRLSSRENNVEKSGKEQKQDRYEEESNSYRTSLGQQHAGYHK